MSFKRDPEKYPLLNGEWLDEFANQLLKKADDGTGAAPVSGAPAMPTNAAQLAEQIAQAVLAEVQNGKDIDTAINEAKAAYPSVTNAATWDKIRGYVQNPIGGVNPRNLTDPNYFAQMVVKSLRDKELPIEPTNVSNEIDGLKKNYPVLNNGTLYQQVRQIVESQFSGANNIDQIAQNFQTYINENAIMNPTMADLDTHLASINVKLFPQEKSIVLQNVSGLRTDANFDALIGSALDRYRGSHGTQDMGAIINDIATKEGLTGQQTQQFRNQVTNLMGKLQANTGIERIANQVVQEALNQKSTDSTLSDDQALQAAISQLQSSGAIDSGADPVYLREVQGVASPLLASKIENLKEIARKAKDSAVQNGTDVKDVLDQMPSLSNAEKTIAINLIQEIGATEGKFNEAALKTEVLQISQELNSTLTSAISTRDTILNTLQGSRDISREQLNAMVTSFENFVTNIQALANALGNFQSTSKIASGSKKIVTAAGGVSGFFKDLWLGQESNIKDFQSVQRGVMGMAHAVAAGMNRLNKINALIQTPNTPPAYKQNFASIMTSFQGLQNSLNNLGKTFGFEPPTIAGMDQVLSNAKQAAESGAQTVDSTTGKAEQGPGQQVPPQQLVNALQGNQGGQGGQGAIDRSSLTRPQPLPTGQETPEQIIYDLQRSLFEFETRVKMHMQKNRQDLSSIDPSLISKMNRILTYLGEIKTILEEQSQPSEANPAAGAGAPAGGAPAGGTPTPGSTANKKNWIKVS